MKRPDHDVTVSRKIGASADALYTAYTQLEKMRGWMGEVNAKVQVGGGYRIRHVEGGSASVHSGVYLVIEPGRRIVMTLRGGPESSPPGDDGRYLNEFTELRFFALGAAEAEVWLLHGWDGEDLDHEAAKSREAAWMRWLARLDAYVTR